MKLEVGMYVRYKPLLSSKYVKINKIKEIEEKENCLHIWLEDKDLITEKYLIKASYNIIDILEEGDYVNGYRVCGGSYGLGILAPTIDIYEMNSCNNGLIHFKFYKLENLDIKSIVTHEQMEQMVYKVEE